MKKDHVHSNPNTLSCGRLEVVSVSGESCVVRRFATYPLRFLFPRNGLNLAAWVYVVTFGGGFVTGDSVSFRVAVGEEAVCVLTSQASTKVYKGDGASQEMTCEVASNGFLAFCPDPIVCFKGSRFKQTQTCHLRDSSANLIFVDIVTCGRVNGFSEFWNLDRFDSSTQIYVDDEIVFLDRIELGNPPGQGFHVSSSMASVQAIATIVLVGPKTKAFQPPEYELAESGLPFAPVTYSTGELVDGRGRVIRIAGSSVEKVQYFLRDAFESISEELLRGNPYD